MNAQNESDSDTTLHATRKTVNDDFFEKDHCDETLSDVDIQNLFKERKAATWNAKNRKDGDSEEVYSEKLKEIIERQKKYGITEEDYEKYLQDIGEEVY